MFMARMMRTLGNPLSENGSHRWTEPALRHQAKNGLNFYKNGGFRAAWHDPPDGKVGRRRVVSLLVQESIWVSFVRSLGSLCFVFGEEILNVLKYLFFANFFVGCILRFLLERFS